MESNFGVTNSNKTSQNYPDVKLWNNRIYNTWADRRAGTRSDIWANVLDWDNPVEISDNERYQTPSAFNLNQNYPNPFNSSTTIQFSLPHTSFVTLKVYNILGEEVSTLVTEELAGGKCNVEWNAGGLVSGVYYYRLQAGQLVEIRKFILLK